MTGWDDAKPGSGRGSTEQPRSSNCRGRRCGAGMRGGRGCSSKQFDTSVESSQNEDP